ncbi:MAG TPA: Na+-dependent transporter [Gammaproteobacteria bacterium]|nr:Na+-dependent transporter [Gammaproteobacteria bacterium]
MTAQQIISLGIQGSMALMVFCVGLHARLDDVLYLLRRPSLLIRSLLAMNVILPAVAVAIALWLDVDRALKVALIALSVSPVPPILPGTQLKAGGRESYVVGLLATAALVSIVFVPAVAALIGRLFGQEVHTAPSAIAWVVVTSILAPLVAGVAVRWLAPKLAALLVRPLSLLATVVLVVAFLPVLVKIWPAIAVSFGNFSFVTIVAFCALGVAVGHVLGGPDKEDRTVLALATASRHPAVALAIVHDDSALLLPVLGIVLVVLIVGAVLGAVYTKVTARASTPGERQRQAG